MEKLNEKLFFLQMPFLKISNKPNNNNNNNNNNILAKTWVLAKTFHRSSRNDSIPT